MPKAALSLTSGSTTGVDRKPKVAEAVSFSTLALGLVMKYDQEEPSIQNGFLKDVERQSFRFMFSQASLWDTDHPDF